MLTGEAATYGHAIPRTPFDLRNGGWGAFQLVARYAELHIDEVAFPLFSNPSSSAHSAIAWAVGLNWYLNRNVLMKLDFSHTTFHGGGTGIIPPGIVTRKDENVLFTRVQLAF
jgi:phosphate-selective porin OprO/OprP